MSGDVSASGEAGAKDGSEGRQTEERRRHLESVLEAYPDLRDRILRSLLTTLHSREIVSIDEIHASARECAERRVQQQLDEYDDNVQIGHRWDRAERRAIQRLTLEYAAQAFTTDEVDDLVNLTRKREEAQTLEEIAALTQVSFGLLVSKVKRFCRLPRGQTTLPERESTAARVALIRNFVSEQLEFIGVAKRYLRIRDFDDLVDRVVGSPDGSGVIGGKAGGMLLGYTILQRERANDPSVPDIPLALPESFYLRSDVIDWFLESNGLQHLQDHKYRDIEEIRKDYPMILELFKNADFPEWIVDRLREILARVGRQPLIVRSSSQLEDRFNTAFAGKYRSVFVANQGDDRERLGELLGAIAEVYASALHPDPISYRKRHQLIDFHENMAILIQTIIGNQAGRYFAPTWSGVAFSRNHYRRNPRVRPEDGLARLVMGLGTRAVDRVASDFPRMVPLGVPDLRAEVAPEDVVRYSQRMVDVIDLESNQFTKIPASTLLGQRGRLPGLELVLSVYRDGSLRPAVGGGVMEASDDLVVTFDRMTSSSQYPAFLKWCVQTLERVYRVPIDVEFACDGKTLYFLQCRPQAQRQVHHSVRVPSEVPADHTLFAATRDVMAGSVHDIEVVVVIDPTDYNALQTTDQRRRVARVVRTLNQRLEGRRFALLGPGRWGSKDLRLGVRVGYSDINNTTLLVEIARARDGYVPEVSFGSHFFQDLIESDIHYLALYPSAASGNYNETFFRQAPNVLVELAPELADMQHVVRVIDVPRATGGLVLNVDMDEENQQALGYLAPARPT